MFFPDVGKFPDRQRFVDLTQNSRDVPWKRRDKNFSLNVFERDSLEQTINPRGKIAEGFRTHRRPRQNGVDTLTL